MPSLQEFQFDRGVSEYPGQLPLGSSLVPNSTQDVLVEDVPVALKKDFKRNGISPANLLNEFPIRLHRQNPFVGFPLWMTPQDGRRFTRESKIGFSDGEKGRLEREGFKC